MPTPTQLGQDAYKAGKDRNANPYRLRGPSQLSWFTGFDMAAAADRAQ